MRTEDRGTVKKKKTKKNTKILPELHKYDYTKGGKAGLGFPKRGKQP